MKYPLHKETFVNAWLSVLDEPDDGDRDLAEAIADCINHAYNAGVMAGKKEASLCRE